MRYLQNFNNFRLLLEKIKKDADYYESREDLHKPADYLIQRLKNLNDKAEKSGGGQTKEDFERKARDMFYDIFNEAIGFVPDDQKSVRKILDTLVVVSKKYLRTSGPTEDYFLILNFTDKDIKDANTILVSDEYLPFSEDSSYSFKLSVRKDFVNTRSTKFEQLFINGIKDTIDRITAIKIIESFNNFYFSNIVPKDPTREKVRELLKKGKTVEQITKSLKLSREEVEKLILRVELQNEYEQEEKESEEKDIEYKSEKPEFTDSESEKIFYWDKMIEDFRVTGRELLRNQGFDKKVEIDFDITVDKYKRIISNNKYEFDNCGGDYRKAICLPLINAIYSNKETVFDKLFNPKNVESVYHLIFVCRKMRDYRSSLSKQLDPVIIKAVTEYNVNLGLLFKFNEIISKFKNKGKEILIEREKENLVENFISTTDKLFIVMVEDKFNRVENIEDETQLSKFLIETLYSKNHGVFGKIFKVENIDSVQNLMLVCNIINGNTNFRGSELSKSIIDLASQHDVNLGMLLGLDRKLSFILGKALDIIYKEQKTDLETQLRTVFENLFKVMIEDKFSDVTILNNPKDFSKFILENVGTKSDSKYNKFFNSYVLVYVCAKISGAEIKNVVKTGVLTTNPKNNSVIVLSALQRDKSDQEDFRIVSDTVEIYPIGTGKIEIKDLLTGVKKKLRSSTAVEVVGFYLGQKPTLENPFFIKSEADIEYY